MDFVLSVTPEGDSHVLRSGTWRYDCLWNPPPSTINLHKLGTKKVTV